MAWEDGKLVTTLDEVRETLKGVVADAAPDFVYTDPNGIRADQNHDRSIKCAYVHGDKPGCIVGQVLHRLGVPLATLAECEDSTATQAVKHVMGLDNVYNCDLPSDVRAISGYLRNVQVEQDTGRTWSDALKRAESFL